MLPDIVGYLMNLHNLIIGDTCVFASGVGANIHCGNYQATA